MNLGLSLKEPQTLLNLTYHQDNRLKDHRYRRKSIDNNSLGLQKKQNFHISSRRYNMLHYQNYKLMIFYLKQPLLINKTHFQYHFISNHQLLSILNSFSLSLFNLTKISYLCSQLQQPQNSKKLHQNIKSMYRLTQEESRPQTS